MALRASRFPPPTSIVAGLEHGCLADGRLSHLLMGP